MEAHHPKEVAAEFIPKRDFVELTSTTFRVAKHPQRLSPQERVLRRLPPGDDPFLPPILRRAYATNRPQQPTRLQQIPRQRPRLVTEGNLTGNNAAHESLRQVSSGAVWNVGGSSAVRDSSLIAASDDTPSTSSNGSSIAPVFVARFLPKKPKYSEQEIHELRLALALGIDPTTRQLGTSYLRYLDAPLNPTSPDFERLSPFEWKDSAWKKVEKERYETYMIFKSNFWKLAHTSSVGLGHQVYLWSEGHGVDYPPFPDLHPSNYVTSLSFSSEDGERSILAVARRSGQLSLWSTLEKQTRFEISHPSTLTCVAFKPRTSRRLSERFMYVLVDVEEIVVGDDFGNIWYYSVEWSDKENQARCKWNGSMTLLAKISAHTQQICGLAWSPDDKYLATGGNDNTCLLFELAEIVPPQNFNNAVSLITPPDSPSSFSLGIFPYLALGTARRRVFLKRPALPSWLATPIKTPIRAPTAAALLNHAGTLLSGGGRTILVPYGRQKHRLVHSAAVKAIAFAPWQSSLLATGGGTNDRAIHFYHTRSGACLATINVFAQVTSLIWSETRREIAATFGYAQPDHPFRIAVFAWPSCAQVAVIPWGPYGTSWDGPDTRISNFDCGRALWAVRYPGKVPHFSGVRSSRPDSQSSSPSSSSSQTRSAERGSSTRGREVSNRKVGARMVAPKEKEGGMWCARTKEEGCIIVASSDQTVKFHEVWTGRRTSNTSACGLFGGSDILEGLEGIEKSGCEVIR
ncbi:WD40/YVTN repeat-like-containing domain [Penicillium digitatum]|uniref:WD40/YVTN repeat-like-containing domain n=1 Tax=Penicillium digitatum TaxID=36651 RepID=A0A7T6XQW8_PENDI|nr:WD40/YVTN repeat-like-containing domain [Penicillium digitatum]